MSAELLLGRYISSTAKNYELFQCCLFTAVMLVYINCKTIESTLCLYTRVAMIDFP